ncbi:MAG: signal peptidase I, partial [Firmicutes bacterium]|nr:signal peptidase I [Bacillota bacterium]
MISKVWSWLGTCLLALFLALLISVFVFQPYKVEGHSMDPTLHDQERIYVSKLQHTFSIVPDYGDIVVIDSRVERERSFLDDVIELPVFQFLLGRHDQIYYVKRVIGRPGDVIELMDHNFYRNAVKLNEPYIKEPADSSADEKWVVPANYIFVMGDNRNNSYDSR